jgi:hypothetical protein
MDGAQIILCERRGAWESAIRDAPFSRGVLFQVVVADIAPIAAAFHAANLSLYMPHREVWCDYGNCTGGRRKIAVQDQNGYLILFAQQIGTRPF